MGMIWSAYRMDEARADELAKGLAAEEDSAFEALEELEGGDKFGAGDEMDDHTELDDDVTVDGDAVGGEATTGSAAAAAADSRMIDVDKSWHALEYLYAAAKATSPISTGRVEGSEDVVVGCVPAARVKAIVAGMERITPALLRQGYDAQRFTREQVYPQIWDEDDVLDVYVMPYDAELREFYRAAAAADEAILWQLN